MYQRKEGTSKVGLGGKGCMFQLSVCVMKIGPNAYYCQILARQAEILQKKSKNIGLFRVTLSQSLAYTNTQKFNCRCQELDPKHFTVSFVP